MDWRELVNAQVAAVEATYRQGGMEAVEVALDEVVNMVPPADLVKIIPGVQQVMDEEHQRGRLGKAASAAILGAELIRRCLPHEWSALTWCLSSHGRILQESGNPLAATALWRECYDLAEKHSKKKIDHANCAYGLGLNLLLCQEKNEALRYFDLAAELYERLEPNGRGLAAAYVGKALVQAEFGNHDQALWWFASSREILENLPGAEFELAENLAANARAYFMVGDYEEAQRLFKRAITFFESRAPKSPQLATALRESADALTLLGRKEHARKAIKHAEKIEESSGFPKMWR